MIAFVIACLLLVTRRITVLTNPQFYFEDGLQFYRHAYNMGFLSLFRPYAGYYHTVPRVIALVATFFPMSWAPLITSVCALLIEAGVAAYMLSDRLSNQIPSRGIRAVLAFLIIAYPNANELYGNIAHSQWFFSILAVIILCAEPGATRFARGLDYFLIICIALTGPFALALAPVAFIGCRKDRRRLIMALILTGGIICAIGTLIVNKRMNTPGAIGIGPLMFMVSSQLFVGAFGGLSYLHQVQKFYEPQPVVFMHVLMSFGAFAILAWGFYRGSRLVRCLIYVGAFTFVTCLKSGSPWLGLARAGQGERYFFVLGIMLILTLVLTLQSSRIRTIQAASAVGCIFAASAIVANWRIPDLKDYHYLDQVEAFQKSPPHKEFELVQPGDLKSPKGWVVKLMKH